MDAPWGVCAEERQYRDRQASLARPFASASREVRREAGVVRGCRLGLATASGVRARRRRQGARRAGVRARRCGPVGDGGLAAVAHGWDKPATSAWRSRRRSGPVVESLMERGFVVHSINPKQLDRFRDRFSPAGAKDDRRDARVLASALRTDPHCLRQLESTDPTIVELREWSRLSEDLTPRADAPREPDAGAALALLPAIPRTRSATTWRRPGHSTCGSACRRRAPAQRVREKTLARLLAKHRIRRIDAPTLRPPVASGGGQGSSGCGRGCGCPCAARRRAPRSGPSAKGSCASPTRPLGGAG